MMMTDEYIKRERIEEFFNGIYDCADLTFYPNDHCCTADDCAHCKWRETMNAIQKGIREIPAADVAPVRHGRWIKSPECPEQYDICSVCGKSDKHRCRGDAEHPALESIPPFCKWCGAKLDKEDQNA